MLPDKTSLASALANALRSRTVCIAIPPGSSVEEQTLPHAFGGYTFSARDAVPVGVGPDGSAIVLVPLRELRGTGDPRRDAVTQRLKELLTTLAALFEADLEKLTPAEREAHLQVLMRYYGANQAPLQAEE